MTTNQENLKQVAKAIFIKTNSRDYTTYILEEIGTEENALKILEYIKNNPNWTEREMTRKVLFVAGALKKDYS